MSILSGNLLLSVKLSDALQMVNLNIETQNLELVNLQVCNWCTTYSSYKATVSFR